MFEGSIRPMLYVSDLQQSVLFYRDKLGFGFKGFWDGENRRVTNSYEEAGEPAYCAVTVADNSIGLHLDPDFEPGDARIELSLQVEDVDAYYEKISQRGVAATDPREQPWGDKMFTLKDPDGHIWNFVTPAGE